MFTYKSSMPILDFDAQITPYDPQHFRAEYESVLGQKIYDIVTSRDGRLVAAMATFGHDPVAPYMGVFIAAYIGPEAFDRRYKQYTGHLIKHVVACMGGRIARTDVDITIPESHYRRATRYERAIA